LERYHDRKILPCGLLFSHTVSEITYDMIRDTLRERLDDESITLQRIEVSAASLFEYVDPGPGKAMDEGYCPVTFIQAWYYYDPEKV
jgi:hypothetical protein